MSWIISDKLQRLMPDAKGVYSLKEGRNPSRGNSIWLAISVIVSELPGVVLLMLWEVIKAFATFAVLAIMLPLLTVFFILNTLRFGIAGRVVPKDHELALREMEADIADTIRNANP